MQSFPAVAVSRMLEGNRSFVEQHRCAATLLGRVMNGCWRAGVLQRAGRLPLVLLRRRSPVQKAGRQLRCGCAATHAAVA